MVPLAQEKVKKEQKKQTNYLDSLERVPLSLERCHPVENVIHGGEEDIFEKVKMTL